MTNYDKLIHILYEVYDVKPPDVDERSATTAALVMDQVDSGERPEISTLSDVDSRIEAIALDYVAAFCDYPLTEDEWEDVFSNETDRFFGDNREPVATSLLRGLEYV